MSRYDQIAKSGASQATHARQTSQTARSLVEEEVRRVAPAFEREGGAIAAALMAAEVTPSHTQGFPSGYWTLGWRGFFGANLSSDGDWLLDCLLDTSNGLRNPAPGKLRVRDDYLRRTDWSGFVSPDGLSLVPGLEIPTNVHGLVVVDGQMFVGITPLGGWC